MTTETMLPSAPSPDNARLRTATTCAASSSDSAPGFRCRRRDLTLGMTHYSVRPQASRLPDGGQRHHDRPQRRLNHFPPGPIPPIGPARARQVLPRAPRAVTSRPMAPGPASTRPSGRRTPGSTPSARGPCPPTGPLVRGTRTPSCPTPPPPPPPPARTRPRRRAGFTASRCTPAIRSPRSAPTRTARCSKIDRDVTSDQPTSAGSSSGLAARCAASRLACAASPAAERADTTQATAPDTSTARRGPGLSSPRPAPRRDQREPARGSRGRLFRSCRTRTPRPALGGRFPARSMASVTSRTFPPDQSTCGEGSSACSVAGSTPCRRASTILITRRPCPPPAGDDRCSTSPTPATADGPPGGPGRRWRSLPAPRSGRRARSRSRAPPPRPRPPRKAPQRPGPPGSPAAATVRSARCARSMLRPG